MTVDDLITAARGGNTPAFDQLVAPFRNELRAQCYRMLDQRDVADRGGRRGRGRRADVAAGWGNRRVRRGLKIAPTAIGEGRPLFTTHTALRLVDS
ncbi:MAG: hypothetical protein M3422_06410 [Actinomycetota bacterium]|nr:hypothetical protein [Actinomycetota bacterium]